MVFIEIQSLLQLCSGIKAWSPPLLGWISAMVALSVVGCQTTEPLELGLYKTLLIENTSREEMELLGVPDQKMVPPDLSGKKNLLVKITTERPKITTITIPIPSPTGRSSMQSQVEVPFQPGVVTRVYLAAKKTGQPVSRSTLVQHALRARCHFSGYLSTDEKEAAKLSVFGTKLVGNYDLRLRSMMANWSEPFEFAAGTKAETILERCRQEYQTTFWRKDRQAYFHLAENMLFGLPRQSCYVSSAQPGSLSDHDGQCRTLGAAGMALNLVMRCVKGDNPGPTGICTPLSRNGGACPVFLDKKLRYQSEPDASTIALASKTIVPSFHCDHRQGLRCRAKDMGKGKPVAGICRPD